MCNSKRFLFAMAVATLLATSGAVAAPVADNNAGPVSDNGAGIDFTALWNDPAAAQAAVDALRTAQTMITAQIAEIRTAIQASADPATQQTLNTALTAYQAQSARIATLRTLYTQGSTIATEAAALSAALALSVEQQATLTDLQQQLATVESSLTTGLSEYEAAQTSLTSGRAALETVLASANVREEDTARTAAADAKADADERLAEIASTRAGVVATLRASGAGAGGSSTKITEGRSSRTASSSRKRIGYTRDLDA